MIAGEDDRHRSPAVSVIIPSHDYARYLPDAIGSLTAQTLSDWECIVVDDGSADDTPQVLARLAADEPRLVGISQARRGASAARNVGLGRARGEFIQFLDADDLLHPAKIDMHVRALHADPQADIVHGPTAYFDDGTPTVLREWHSADRPARSRAQNTGAPMLSQLLMANPMTIEAPLIRKSVLDRVGGFDEGLDRMEDWDLWLRCAIDGARFVFVSSTQPVARVRVHPASASHSSAQMLVSEIAVRRKIRTMLSRPSDRALNDRRLDDARAQAGKLLGLGGDARGGLRYLLTAAVSQRNPMWFAWILALLLTPIPGIRRLMGRLRERRRHKLVSRDKLDE